MLALNHNNCMPSSSLLRTKQKVFVITPGKNIKRSRQKCKPSDLRVSNFQIFTTTWFVQLQKNNLQGFFNDKLQFSRTKINSINQHPLPPLITLLAKTTWKSWHHLRFVLLRPSLIPLFYTTFRNKTSQNDWV